jgi:molecular chaperone GrpE
MTNDQHDEHIEDEVVEAFEDTDLEGDELQAQDKLKTLREKLKVCEAEKMAALEDVQRARADFLNSKKRLEEQKLADIERVAGKFVASLLPLADSFQMAMADKAAWEQIDPAWRTGVEGIQNQLNTILKNHDVTQIDALGAHFDHDLHEAIGTEASEGESDVVLKVVQAGYKMGDMIIRPAKVIISE